MNVGIFDGVTGGAARFRKYFEQFSAELKLIDFSCAPSYENLKKIKEADCSALIYFCAKQESGEWFRQIAEMGIRYLCTPSKGYDHFNLQAMKKNNIRGANVPGYSPAAITEHTVLLLLAVLRHLRTQILNIERADYSKTGLLGREIHNMNIGVVGTGKIGAAAIRILSGFAPAGLYACGHHKNPAIDGLAQYVGMDELYRRCDAILFHCNYTEENYHMVNAETIAQMKDGVILINTARGALFDTVSVANAVKSGKIGGLGLDVIEGEEFLRGRFPGREECPLPLLAELLNGYPVLFTNHTAFFTEEAFEEITKTTVSNLLAYERTGSCENELVQ